MNVKIIQKSKQGLTSFETLTSTESIDVYYYGGTGIIIANNSNKSFVMVYSLNCIDSNC